MESALEKHNRNQEGLDEMALLKVQGWQSMVKPTQRNKGLNARLSL